MQQFKYYQNSYYDLGNKKANHVSESKAAFFSQLSILMLINQQFKVSKYNRYVESNCWVEIELVRIANDFSNKKEEHQYLNRW